MDRVRASRPRLCSDGFRDAVCDKRDERSPKRSRGFRIVHARVISKRRDIVVERATSSRSVRADDEFN